MNLRAAAKAVSTSAASSAGGCESSSSGLCDIETRASVMVISKVNGGGKGGGNGWGVLGEGGGGDVAVGANDDEADGVGVEPLFEPAGGIADHGDVDGSLSGVVGERIVPVQLGGRPDAD